MIDAGHSPQWVAVEPVWLNAGGVHEICSVSNCISSAPDDWIERWLHNEFGWFNRGADALSVVQPDQAAHFRLFACCIYTDLFRGWRRHEIVLPPDVHPDAMPETFTPRGFDSVSKSFPSVLGFECSPLSCNVMAREMGANECCLFDSLDAAIAGASRFSIEQPEPGDYYVAEVFEDSRAA